MCQNVVMTSVVCVYYMARQMVFPKCFIILGFNAVHHIRQFDICSHAFGSFWFVTTSEQYLCVYVYRQWHLVGRNCLVYLS